MRPEIAHDALAMVDYGSEAAVLVLADSAAGEARARLAAGQAGCRVVAATDIGCGLDRIDRQVRMDAVLIDIERDHGDVLDRLLDRIEAAARLERHGSVVSADAALIDVVAARTPHPRVLQLSQPEPSQWAGAVAQATAPVVAQLYDIRKAPPTPRLQQLSEEVSRIATILAALSEGEAGAMATPTEADDGAGIDAGAVRAMIRARRLRDHYFQTELFADPAWDMLLDLMAARLEGAQVAVSSLCIAAAVPATTALRWIKALTERGLFVRAADPQDGRRVYIELSDAAAESLISYLRAAQRLAPLAI